ncbi:helix-turn-helix transcriptional regulator [Corynebacterium sp.]|uniref:helix-turn-helix domain-containing protein n=1 Tax=Corynebacterium sp. TaxID=1720 RepID=UPI0028A64114|nr:helix-turn-helix transcriptional regulator [Corynebacterium sp.]
MAESEWAKLVSKLVEERGVTRLARMANVSRGVIYKWMEGTTPEATTVIQFAKSLGVPPVAALVTAGYLDDDISYEGPKSLEAVPDDDLLDEVKRRFNR